MAVEVPEHIKRRLWAVGIAIVLLKFGLDLDFGVGFGVVLVAPVIVLYLALLAAMYFAVGVLVKDEEKRTTIFMACSTALAVSAYIHLICLLQYMIRLLSKCLPPYAKQLVFESRSAVLILVSSI